MIPSKLLRPEFPIPINNIDGVTDGMPFDKVSTKFPSIPLVAFSILSYRRTFPSITSLLQTETVAVGKKSSVVEHFLVMGGFFCWKVILLLNWFGGLKCFIIICILMCCKVCVDLMC